MKPYVIPEFCKGCARCLEACTKGCIQLGTEINPLTGLVPVTLDLSKCTGCSLCSSACPEPYGLRMISDEQNQKVLEGLVLNFELEDPAKLFGEKHNIHEHSKPETISSQVIPLPEGKPMMIKGTYAAAMGALLAGCRHVIGYPITPSTEGAEFMAKYLPELEGVFYQAPSETATVNVLYGVSGAGLPCITFTSSPGFSLMLEGVSYMIGAELPAVFVNIMRGGPGLGNIAPEQSDIKMACRGLGHGNTHAITLAPATPQEMLDLSILAFELAFKYRNPVMIFGDGYLGQITGKVNLPKTMIKPGLPSWAVWGDQAHRQNLICSIYLSEQDLSDHNVKLNAKYDLMKRQEARAEEFLCDDADIIIVACNTPSQMALGAVHQLRKEGLRVGLFRPITLWPFPGAAIKKYLSKTKTILVVEASNGQLEDELRLALSYEFEAHKLETPNSLLKMPQIENVRRFGGLLPQVRDIVEKVRSMTKTSGNKLSGISDSNEEKSL